MRNIRISDTTQRACGNTLTFREKIELAERLDGLGVDVIETEGLENAGADALRIKAVAAAVERGTVAVPVKPEQENIDAVFAALGGAKHPRLQVALPVSAVQMEYSYHKKPAAMLELIRFAVGACREKTADVEFIAGDADGAERAFLLQALRTAAEAGASTLTLSEDAGMLLPIEFGRFVSEVIAEAAIPGEVTFGVSCSNALSMADGCCAAAAANGAGELKTAVGKTDGASLANVAEILFRRGETLGVETNLRYTALRSAAQEIAAMLGREKKANSPFENGVREWKSDLALQAGADKETVLKEAARLGYDLSEEDGDSVYAEFRRVAARKDKVTRKELEAVIAAAAMQVPATYVLESFTVNCGSATPGMAHIRLLRDGKRLEGISLGAGPIDAAFLAIENTVGRHFELDDFQLQSVTEGREAMGRTLVMLRAEGKVYSGMGLSTDIIASGIMAYLNALNKIVYEEAEA